MTTFPLFAEEFDPQDQKEYTFRFKLRDDETAITSAVVEEVDATSTTLVTPTKFNFGTLSQSVIATPVWGVTQWLLPMVSEPGSVTTYLRCKVTTNHSPTPRVYTRTMRLVVTQR